MDATTPKIENMTPNTGRMVNDQNKVITIVDNFGNLKTIGVLNSSVHAGTSFTYSGEAPITALSQVYFHGKTGNITSHLMEFFVKSDASPITVEFFEAPILTSEGTSKTVIARNRQASNTPLMSVFVNPTVTASGTILFVDKILGDKQTVTSEHLDGEWILKKNTSYLFKVTNNTNQTVNVVAGFNWIEAD